MWPLSSVSPGELLFFALILLLFFGSKRLPDLARSIGKSLNEFKKGREEGTKPDEPAAGGDKEGSPKDGKA